MLTLLSLIIHLLNGMHIQVPASNSLNVKLLDPDELSTTGTTLHFTMFQPKSCI